MPLFSSRTARPSRSATSSDGSPPPRRIRSPSKHAALDPAIDQQLGAEAVFGPEHVEGDHRGGELDGGGRDQRQVGIELGQLLAARQVDQQVADRGAGRARGHHGRRGAPVGQGDRCRGQHRLELALDVVEDLLDGGLRGARRDRRGAAGDMGSRCRIEYGEPAAAAGEGIRARRGLHACGGDILRGAGRRCLDRGRRHVGRVHARAEQEQYTKRPRREALARSHRDAPD